MAAELEQYSSCRAGSGWELNTLYAFHGNDGANPQARVVFGPDGTLYGTTTYGGLGESGIVFNLKPPAHACRTFSCSWTETVLYRFTGGSDGSNPGFADLTFDAAGNIYGTTISGGIGDCHGGCGVVYELSRSGSGWRQSVLYSFPVYTNANPYSGVIFDGSGNLYGTTLSSVYELSPSGSGWTESTLYQPLSNAYGGLIFDQQGNLYGTTFGAGQSGGTVYELQRSSGNWTYQLLAAVDQGPTDTPTLDAAGNLYATLGGPFFLHPGQVFELTPGSNGWTYQRLFSFGSAPVSDGAYPSSSVVLDPGGNLYGTTFADGEFNENCGEGCGTVWEITP